MTYENFDTENYTLPISERSLRVLEYTKIRAMLAEYTVSEMGHEQALKLVPSGDAQLVKRRQAETEEALSILAYNGSNPLAPFSDVRSSLKLAAIGSTLSAKAILQTGDAIKASRLMRNALVTDREDTPILREMGSLLYTNRSLEEDIFDAILSEDEISDQASSDLADIRRHMRLLNDRIREKLNSIIRNPSTQKYLMDNIITMRNGRYVVPVKAECRSSVPGIVHDQSGTGSTLFIEPMSVVEAGNELKQWSLKEKAEIERILAAFSAQIGPDSAEITDSLEILAQMDTIFARAYLGRSMHAVPPKLNTEGRINLISARHPLINPETVVPSNLWLGTDFTTLVITGPNTGGKTVTLKTVGLLCLMCQAGMQIPAQYGSELPVFDSVFADIGDEQSIEQSLSTFSSHMTNIVSFLDQVTDNSLVLFDELGAGTDPTEGAALAMSILEKLLKRGIRTMATTHYAELKVFALTTPGVENASVEFNVSTLQPTYRLSIGIPGKSNAFEISSKLGLPDSIINNARERLTHDQVRFEDVIANAEYHRQIAEKERKLAEEAHRETQQLRDEAEKLRQELVDQREKSLKKARDEAKRILVSAQHEADALIADLKKKNAGTLKEHEIQAMKAHLQEQIDANSEHLKPASQAPGEVPREVHVGDTVEITTLGTKGTVLTLPDAKGESQVQAGALKIKVKLADMRVAEPDKKKPPKASGKSKLIVRAAETECDVRGYTLEEAIATVDLFLDGAVLNHLKEVNIIHGKGTGTLRAGIHKFLKTHSGVKEFRLGHYGEGEDGVTVVSMK